MSGPAASDAIRPPAAFWLLPATIALLRALPALSLEFGSAPEGHDFLPVGYIPKDFLQYIAFMRQTAEHGDWLWANPFTTEAQDGRFFMPFLALLGAFAGITGLAPSTVLELARIPLVFALFALLWRFLATWLPNPSERLHASALIALSGGLDAFARPLAPALPEGVAHQLTQSTWPLYGWTTFELCYNPLWIAGMLGVLFVLGTALRIVERSGRPDGEPIATPAECACLFAGYLATHWTHPYSAIGLLAALAGIFAMSWIAARQIAPPHSEAWSRIALSIAPALGIALLVADWQAGDPVYAAASSNLFGAQIASPFWLPLTYGALFVLALQGAAQWASRRATLRVALLGWVGAVVLLHSSPVLNGYHFVSFLHIPAAIAAAPALGSWIETFRNGSSAARRGLAAAALGLLFVDPVATTFEAVAEAREHHTLGPGQKELLGALAERPAGRLLAPPRLGNAIPAFTDHRVWVGHHFLTPDSRERRIRFQRLVTQPDAAAELRELIDAEAISAVVVGSAQAKTVEQALAPRIARRASFGPLRLLELASSQTNPREHP